MEKNEGVALYFKLKEILEQRIKSGFYPVGTTLPAEKQLMQEFNVSRETVRRAIKVLEDFGYIKTRQGMKTYVLRANPFDAIEPIASFSAELQSRGYSVGTKLLKKSFMDAPSDIKTILQSDKTLYTKRIRFVNNIPFAVEDSYFSEDIAGLMSGKNLEHSYYHLIVHECGVEVSKITQEISSRVSTKEEERLLGLSPNTPMLVIKRIWFKEDKPFYYLEFIARSDVYSVKSEVKI
jgi:GntR family transcriptional regulator